MTLDSFNSVILCIAPVAVHDKGYVLRDGTLAESPDEEFAEDVQRVFRRRRRQQPAAYAGHVTGRHCGRVELAWYPILVER